MDKKTLFKKLCSVEELLNDEILIKNTQSFPRWLIVQSVRDTIDHYRQIILNSDGSDLENIQINRELLVDKAIKTAHSLVNHSLTHVINATGIVVHTNLGRSLLPEAVTQAITRVATHYTDLEMELESGNRNVRGAQAVELLKLITGAEDALIVNNNAAAVFLILSCFAKGKEVIVSRGEQVEIGGSFRIPEVMNASGATLVEVGATNKTKPSDYRNAITENTALLMKIHTSNFVVLGFTQEVSLEEMKEIADEYDLPVVHDLGSGSLIDLSAYGLPKEPTVAESVAADVDLISFSGDKLLGSAQAGIILGKKKYIEKLRKHQLLRALRVDKLTLAGLTESLKIYIDPDRALKTFPTLRMLTMSYDETVSRAERLYRMISDAGLPLEIDCEDDCSNCGGGAMPLAHMPSRMVIIRKSPMRLQALCDALRRGKTPVIARLKNDCIFFDTRTVQDDEFIRIVEKLSDILI